jgi:hypothetical protein
VPSVFAPHVEVSASVRLRFAERLTPVVVEVAGLGVGVWDETAVAVDDASYWLVSAFSSINDEIVAPAIRTETHPDSATGSEGGFEVLRFGRAEAGEVHLRAGVLVQVGESCIGAAEDGAGGSRRTYESVGSSLRHTAALGRKHGAGVVVDGPGPVMAATGGTAFRDAKRRQAGSVRQLLGRRLAKEVGGLTGLECISEQLKELAHVSNLLSSQP